MTFNRSTYEFNLPKELIAQYPVIPRDHSRLMVIDREKGSIEHKTFRDLLQYLNAGDGLVFNNTKVIPARLIGKLSTGGKVEVFLSEEVSDGAWVALTRPARKLKVGTKVIFSEDFSCEVIEVLDEGARKVVFNYEGVFHEHLMHHGEIPLPQYIQRTPSVDVDNERYQTVYAQESGAVAAPTAGLHFTPELLVELEKKGVIRSEITLHVGLGTFKPVVADDIRDHKMHDERYKISERVCNILNTRDLSKRQICVGTTCCRTLESAADSDGIIKPGSGRTDIFIYPGYQFKYVSSLLTNFHLPGSTLLMLVSAFAGSDLIKEAYEQAVQERYRFFSYGDAMLIL